VRYLLASPAMERLGWILDGLNGAAGWGADAADVFAPEFAELVPPDVFTGRVRQRAAVLAPATVTGFDMSDHAARARIRVRDGSVHVVTCTAGAEFRVVVCACSDRTLHRARLERRQRGIPGWHEGGNWVNVERRLAKFPPWTGDVLAIDAARPLAQNLAAVLAYVTD